MPFGRRVIRSESGLPDVRLVAARVQLGTKVRPLHIGGGQGGPWGQIPHLGSFDRSESLVSIDSKGSKVRRLGPGLILRTRARLNQMMGPAKPRFGSRPSWDQTRLNYSFIPTGHAISIRDQAAGRPFFGRTGSRWRSLVAPLPKRPTIAWR